MKKLFNLFGFLLILPLLLESCKSENIGKKPDPFIEKEQFIELIYDINILEGGLSNFNLNQDIIKDSAMTMYKGIFEKHNVSFDDFKNNQEYYVLTDKYKEISEKVLEKVRKEEEKYKQVTPVKIISFIQFSALLEGDGLLPFFNKDTTKTYNQRLDSALYYYRINAHRLTSIDLDSISFEVNIRKFKKGADLFQLKKSVFKKMPTNE
ncbi:DUF4296 domain-containing protein [Flavobacteriales bacterium]|nr:DUF4296 domain-containing protein [Flavobacteriales bacterium]